MKKIKEIIKKRFTNYNFKKIILFKNPNECNSMYIEILNSSPIGIIWGKRKKDLNKGTNYIQIGKVYLTIIILIYSVGGGIIWH